MRVAMIVVCAVLVGCTPQSVAPDLGAGSVDSGLDDASADSGRNRRDAGACVVPAIERPTFVAANSVPAGDPLFEGQQRFLWDAFGTEVLDSWPPAQFLVDLQRSEPAVFGNQFEQFGFIADPNDDLPVGLKRGIEDPSKVHETCALCHVSRLADGRIWFGAPAVNLDFGRFQVEVDRRWVAAGNASMTTDLASRKALLLGPGRTNAESGNYPQVVPAEFPPYFDLGRRTAMNYMGTGQNMRTEVAFSIFTFGAGAPNAATARVPFPCNARLDPFLAFFGQLQAPSGPAQNAQSVAAGRSVFERERCGSCHHVDDISLDGVTTIERDPARAELYPGDNPQFPRGTIRTSPLHRILQDGDGTDAGVDQGRDDLIAFLLAQRLSVAATDGYRVNTLHGLWATAPYLHNGSVPTLEDLLRPQAQRPATFMRGTFTVDTTLDGNSNQGHEFGTQISETDRAALVAYLRSL